MDEQDTYRRDERRQSGDERDKHARPVNRGGENHAAGPGTSMYGPAISVPVPEPEPSAVPKIDTLETTTPATSAPVPGAIAAHVTTYPSGRSRSCAIPAVSACDIHSPLMLASSRRTQSR